MTIKVLIVDDEPLARDAVSLRLAGREAYEVCGQAANGEDAIQLAKALKPDVIFLDVEMPEMDGIETAGHLLDLGPQNIVFVTAYDHFAVQAFEVNAVDYLLKPIKDNQFASTLVRLAERINAHETMVQNKRLIEVLEQLPPESLTPDGLPADGLSLDGLPAAHSISGAGVDTTSTAPRRIAIKDGTTTKLLEVADIESIVSGKDYICIKVNDDVLVHRCTMKKFISTLPPNFVHCHRSHTVNIDHVVAIDHIEGHMELVCQSGDRHPVSRRYKSMVKKQLDLPGD